MPERVKYRPIHHTPIKDACAGTDSAQYCPSPLRFCLRRVGHLLRMGIAGHLTRNCGWVRSSNGKCAVENGMFEWRHGHSSSLPIGRSKVLISRFKFREDLALQEPPYVLQLKHRAEARACLHDDYCARPAGTWRRVCATTRHARGGGTAALASGGWRFAVGQWQPCGAGLEGEGRIGAMAVGDVIAWRWRLPGHSYSCLS